MNLNLNLRTDRTQADVELVATLRAKIYSQSATAAEIELWNSASLKGSYNVTDLNRVGYAVAYLTERLKVTGLEVSTTPKTDWQEQDVPTQAELQQYLVDVATLKNAVPPHINTPELPTSMNKLTYVQANNIESVLQLVELWLHSFMAALRYSGDLYSGEI